MRFRAQVTNANLLLRVVQCIEKLSKNAMLKLTQDKLHIIVLTDMDSGLQLWSDVVAVALFSEYRVESLHNNEIYLEFNIDNLQRALRSAQGAQRVTLKLTKKQNLPVLSLVIKNISGTGREMTLNQDVPVRVLTPDQVSAIMEPQVPTGPVHIMMPPLNSVRSITERLKLMGDRVSIAANREGQVTMRVANDRVEITTYFRGLQNMTHDSSEPSSQLDRPSHEFYTATVDMKNFTRFLQSYHIAPKNIVCCILEHRALVFYVYIGSTSMFGDAGVDNLNDQTCGSLTYYIPVRQV
ncbi:Checkpoint protein hus1 [Coemansia sp. RSA 989]|nr:checkpoint protein Hus1/Mec3 [Coemansia mojavensis]KAJ1741409.1 Checkpoint protein hus1 [Coemansia sp. RSA 1086]KAJ1749730.1 Checkpoint protein hus1 [Coemansia sp. RSA 1821]KAJ1863915.1 Checkpoint protein hus1 [Coemansia sp. RSA 989]KAJ1871646.1 Checkpoint protein hus1 [Coemansia sp. RSA 990]KAJ2454832.1 Checkpoint protein hus1 [Coemansia sp. RSA 2336]KAJ2633620.1 Checkpoint protein hus1 [Coemansia sp. RSA 1290]KAJ2650285.1 Checkpoint protein hus1 [Coemansia sp. RSA 1250]KAJ2675670.1 Che